jgi:squalene-associated FAD-dependent desaturase
MVNNNHVAVIGGGCAGLSAAAELVDRGYAVTIFEASSQLGGRARTVVVENNDLMHQLDNGQHILLGAYRETLALLRKVGVDEKQAFLRVPLQITMQSSIAKSEFSLKSVHYLPAPLDMLFGLLTCKGLSFSERMTAIKLMVHLKRSHYQIESDAPLEPFLISQKQTTHLIKMLWEPLCLAALNTPIENASTRIFLNILRDTFSGNKKNSDFLLPRLDLSQIIAYPLSRYIRSKGGVIQLNKRICSLSAVTDITGKEGFNLETRNEKYFFSHVVLAVSPARIDLFLAHLPKLQRTVEQIQTYTYQPIYTIYLQYPTETELSSAMTGLSNPSEKSKIISQWVFDRGQLCGQKGLMAVIVSAEGDHQKLTHDELALTIARELSHAFPNLPKPLWHKVIAEKRATFSCVTNLARPTNKTAQPHLYLAGDYTYADYPATIESAVRSGIACANLITNS